MSRPAFPYRMLTICAFLIWGAVLAGYAQPGNPLPNPSFEQVNPDTQYPEYWGKHWTYKGLWLVKQDAPFAHRGSVSLGVHQAGPEAHKAFTGLPGKRLEVRGSRSYHTSA